MIDCHIHIEKGDYTKEWINEFVKTAVKRDIKEIYLLEHSYRFLEFMPMYKMPCIYSSYINKWFNQKAGAHKIDDYLRLIDHIKNEVFEVDIKFGLEICYFKEFEEFVYKNTNGKSFDFLVGSVHFVDGFAFDHNLELWQGENIDKVYNRYFELSIELAKSRIFNGIAHPDSIKLFGHKPSFELKNIYDDLASMLSKSHMYAEQNCGAHRRFPDSCELGMDKDLIKALKDHDVNIKTASDAHTPEDVGLYILEMNNNLKEI